MSSEELEKELYGSIEAYITQINESVKNRDEFIKENRKDWEKWKKQQKKEKKDKSKGVKHSKPVELTYLPDNCKIKENSVGVLFFH